MYYFPALSLRLNKHIFHCLVSYFPLSDQTLGHLSKWQTWCTRLLNNPRGQHRSIPQYSQLQVVQRVNWYLVVISKQVGEVNETDVAIRPAWIALANKCHCSQYWSSPLKSSSSSSSTKSCLQHTISHNAVKCGTRFKGLEPRSMIDDYVIFTFRG